MAPPVCDPRRSLAQSTVDRMRREGTLDRLTGHGTLSEHDMEIEWQHKLDTSPSWQEKMSSMTSHQRENFLRHKHDAFLEGIRKAFTRAQAKLSSSCFVRAEDGGSPTSSREVQCEEEGREVADTLTGVHRNRPRELNGFQQESRELMTAAAKPELLQKTSQPSRVASKQGLSPKEYEALALAMFQRNRLQQGDPQTPELSQEEYEAHALRKIKEERKQQGEGSEKLLLYQELRRRKKEKRKSKRKAFDDRREKSNAKQEEFKSKKKARKAGREAANEQAREAREVQEQAEANGPSPEELVRQRREAKKKRKRAALDAGPRAKEEREQRSFGFRYFPNEKARAGAERQLLENEASCGRRRRRIDLPVG